MGFFVVKLIQTLFNKYRIHQDFVWFYALSYDDPHWLFIALVWSSTSSGRLGNCSSKWKITFKKLHKTNFDTYSFKGFGFIHSVQFFVLLYEFFLQKQKKKSSRFDFLFFSLCQTITTHLINTRFIPIFFSFILSAEKCKTVHCCKFSTLYSSEWEQALLIQLSP